MKSKKTLVQTGGSGLLIEVEGQEGVARFAESCRIGRERVNDLVIEDRSVSMRHAEVVFEDGTWWLRDLDSTNGTIVGGVPIDSLALEGPVRVRLGYQGPTLRLTPEGLGEEIEPTETAVPSESSLVKRYFARRAPGDIGAHTAALRRAFVNVTRRRRKKYVVALLLLTLLGGGASGYAYLLQKKFERQRAAAEELFYAAKELELAIARLGGSEPERQRVAARQDQLGKQYRDYLEELGIYSDDTPEEVRLIYRVAHRFGESEVNIPPEFVDEARRYIARWKTSSRLKEAVARGQLRQYGQRIADILVENDLPPEFFYLALQESDLRLEATGPETRFGIAKGMWQFVPGTARDFGLKTGPLVGVRRPDPMDERHDFEKSTQAAAGYLRHIYTTDAQASGLLVVASYNWGQSNVLRLIRSMPENPRQRNFWQLLARHRDRIPKETYDYVFSIFSAAVIGEDPQLFGFDFERPFARPGLMAASGQVAESEETTDEAR